MGAYQGSTGCSGCCSGCLLPGLCQGRRWWCEPGSCCPAGAFPWGWAQLPPCCSVICFFRYQFSKSTWWGTGGRTVIICVSSSILCTLRRDSEIRADMGLLPFVWVSHFKGSLSYLHPLGSCCRKHLSVLKGQKGTGLEGEGGKTSPLNPSALSCQ